MALPNKRAVGNWNKKVRKGPSITQKKTFFHLSAALLIFTVTCFGQQNHPQIQPVDDSHKDSSFLAFRNRLLGALGNRDTSFIYNCLAEDIMVGFGADGVGQEAFKSQWHSNDPQSVFWTALKDAVELGCVAEMAEEEGNFKCPYIYALWPDMVDAFSYVVLIGNAVPLYSMPSESSKIVRNVDNAIVRVLSWKPTGWVKVEDPVGKGEVFAKRSFAASAVDTRVIFQKIGTEWEIKAMIEGD